MKIIISPAKKMEVHNDFLEAKGLPVFLNETKELMLEIQKLSYDGAKLMWKCNDSLAQLNFERFKKMDLHKNLTPALLTYEGLQYQYMGADLLSYRQLDYLQENLRILSGFYGILKPFDGVVPYRLEMQARINLPNKVNTLYKFWGDKLYQELIKDEKSPEIILNLASKEYSKAIEPFLSGHESFVTCTFASLAKDGKLKVKATEAKIARGQMVRFMAENSIMDLEEVKVFTGRNFHYQKELSDEKNLVFVQQD